MQPEEARSLLLSQWAEAGGVSIQAQASTTSAEVDPQWLAERVQEGLQPLLSSLRLSLYAMSSKQPPESLVVTGEARKIPGFAKSLSELTGLKTQSASLSVPAGMEICHALALRAAGRRARDLDFRTGSLAYKGDLARYRMLFTYGSLGIVGLAMAGMLLFGLRYQQLRAEIQQMELTIQETTTELFPEVGASVASTPMQARAAAAEQAMNTTLRLEASSPP